MFTKRSSKKVLAYIPFILSILLQSTCPIKKLSILLQNCPSCYKAAHPVINLFILLQSCPSCYKSVHPTKLAVCYNAAVHPVTNMSVTKMSFPLRSCSSLQNCPSYYKIVHPVTKLSQPTLQFSHTLFTGLLPLNY